MLRQELNKNRGSIESPFVFVHDLIYRTPELKTVKEREALYDYIINAKGKHRVCHVLWETLSVLSSDMELVNKAYTKISKVYYNLYTLKDVVAYAHMIYTIQTYMLGIMKLFKLGLYKYGNLDCDCEVTMNQIYEFPFSMEELVEFAKLCL